MTRRTARKNGYKYYIEIYLNDAEVQGNFTRGTRKFYKTYNGVLREYQYFKKLLSPRVDIHIYDISSDKLLI